MCYRKKRRPYEMCSSVQGNFKKKEFKKTEKLTIYA